MTSRLRFFAKFAAVAAAGILVWLTGCHDNTAPVPPDPRAATGEWSAPIDWPVVAVHVQVLPDGQVLSWGRGAYGPPQLWNPATGAFVAAPAGADIFCGGHSFLADGRLLVTGGHLDDFRGIPDAHLFDPATHTWQAAASMAHGRWYPTNTTLPDGRVLTIGGSDETTAYVAVPEVWDGTSWHELPGATRVLPYYPRMFVAPNGLLFYAGELDSTGYLDPSGAGAWTNVAVSHYGRRDYGSAVMYEPGKVLIVGGSDPPDGVPTNTAEVIDLNDASPAWRYTGAMAFARRHLNAVLLPDGTVLATGGSSAGGFANLAGAVYAVEQWSPVTETWTTLASSQVARVYHSSSVLLPDGRVLHTGSGDGASLPRELNAEIFSPPYLFRGRRPVIAAAPATVSYGQQFAISTPDRASIGKVSWIRLPSVTHAFDQNQRFNWLPFERAPGGLLVAAPSGPSIAPPGDYMLFLLNAAGVPSVAKVVRIQ